MIRFFQNIGNNIPSILQYSPAIVLIKILKCLVKMLIPFKSVLMHCGRYEFKIVNRPISINIGLRNIIHEKTILVEFKIIVMRSTSYAFVTDL